MMIAFCELDPTKSRVQQPVVDGEHAGGDAGQVAASVTCACAARGATIPIPATKPIAASVVVSVSRKRSPGLTCIGAPCRVIDQDTVIADLRVVGDVDRGSGPRSIQTEVDVVLDRQLG